jgi:HPt (histidine-containing phosphotransfer) domain-containing protein
MSVDLTVLEVYREIMGEETDAFIADIINTFIINVPKLITEMEKNIITGDKKTFIRNAHTLKSNSGTIGALKLSGLAAILESEGEHLSLPALTEKLSEAKAELDQVIAFVRK